MQVFRVIDRGFHVGAGALMLLAAGQVAERGHKLEIVKDGEQFALVKARELQAFKAGELLGLSELPKGQLHLVEQLEGPVKKDDPAAGLRKAVADLQAAAEASERAANQEREAAAKKAADEQLKAAAAAAEQAWTDEWKATEATRKEFPKLADYLAARKKESTTNSAG